MHEIFNMICYISIKVAYCPIIMTIWSLDLILLIETRIIQSMILCGKLYSDLLLEKS